MTAGAVLLAAGASRRFGSDKRRHRLEDGTPLLSASVSLYAAAFEQLIVVLRPEDDDLAAAVSAAATGTPRVVRCADAHLGMGHSLAAGIRAAAGWRYAFVALADMAWVRVETLARLRAVLTAAPPDAIVQPAYHGAAGHPVGFGAAHFARLCRLSGDEGARSLVREARAQLVTVDVDDPGVLEDLDTPPRLEHGPRG
ncbi:MAG: nucleotidyltransferase family protein [Pseudomonadales bacterium]